MDEQDRERLKELRDTLKDLGTATGPYAWIKPDWARDMGEVLDRALDRLEETCEYVDYVPVFYKRYTQWLEAYDCQQATSSPDKQDDFF